VPVQDADVGDTATLVETLMMTADHLSRVAHTGLHLRQRSGVGTPQEPPGARDAGVRHPGYSMEFNYLY